MTPVVVVGGDVDAVRLVSDLLAGVEEVLVHFRRESRSLQERESVHCRGRRLRLRRSRFIGKGVLRCWDEAKLVDGVAQLCWQLEESALLLLVHCCGCQSAGGCED